MTSSIPAFQFMTATTIHFGRKEAARNVAALGKLGSPLLLVHGRDGTRVEWLLEALIGQGVEVVAFSAPSEPDVALIEEGVARARATQVKAIVAIGGGAVIDTGKALAALVPAKRPVMDHLEVVGKGLPLEQAPLPFAALPTTAGTGAEVTKNAVLTVPEAARKVSLRDPRMLPTLAIVDPELTDYLPRAITLASGLDAVTQVIEPYLSCKANILTDLLCRDAIPQGLKALTTLMKAEDKGARDALAWTSLCGGLALANAGLGAVHGLAGVLGGETGAAHGALCGALLPHVLTANEQEVRVSDALDEGERIRLLERFAEVRGWIGGALGCPADQALDELAIWSGANALPGLQAQGVENALVPSVAKASAASSSMKGNPVPLSLEALEAILHAAG
ncbi:iron-containing alcohol dehydrogenase [Cohaesibacter haloalkalitolerans]|uniref:iron-containing alcohol dehydrogenase n=1 Tax=Cohaesibacter haloalkalitolerans TaxID=1162980 RepID=UPI00196955CF|nr:iron-containing alcohol dehydrogenase [Cohaesibacter haloalkalitolerans]